MNYKIIDNFLDTSSFLTIKNICFNEMPWYYAPYVADKTDDKNYYFVHVLFENFIPKSDCFKLLEPFINLFNIKSILKAKVNFYPSNSVLQTHKFHRDYEYEHKGLVFYVNTNDGYTELEDGTKIESIENRVLLFDSSNLHRSTNCTNQNGRVTININYF